MNIHRLAKTTPAGRALLVNRVAKEGWSVEEAALSLSLSVRRAYAWLARFKGEGPAGLTDRSSVPHRKPGKTPVSREAIVLELRALRFTAQRISDTYLCPNQPWPGSSPDTGSRVCRRCSRRRKWCATSTSGRGASSTST